MVPTPPSSGTTTSHPGNNNRRHRGGGGGRGPARGRGGPPRQAWVPRSQNQDVPDAAILPTPSPSWPAGAVVRGRGRGQRQSHDALRAGGDVPQLVQEIQDKLAKGAVECMICYDMVRRSAAVWSCSSCYSIFHLACIRKWARSPTSTDTSSSADAHANWRCPGCQSVQVTPAKDLHYTCFCARRRDPPNDLYLTPHSCGEPCGKPLYRGGDDSSSDGGRCPHLCVLQCHPGPCPPCKAFAPPRRCPCGKKSVVLRCSDQTAPVTCGQRCDRLLGCGRHWCEKTCHTCPCEACQVTIAAVCFCGKKKEVVMCREIAVEGEIREDVGIFSCAGFCGNRLGCGNHLCVDVCHPGPCRECKSLPEKVKACYCGKTQLKERRGSCLDPIPTCPEICRKLLPCRLHMCRERCHAGDCPPCLVLVNQKCRCGSTLRKIECFKTLDEKEMFSCDKPCGRKKNCGRHRCSERCCPLSSSRDAIGQFSGDWDPHLCQMPCGKKLRCGQHTCQSLCHSGHCPPCLETIFHELTCACGKTSLPPPLPCGTPYPSCPHPCMVPQPCGHSGTHICHFGDCPPCPMPVAKECIGGHVVLRNIPCGSKDIRCNQLCGRTRQCGMHACARACHPPPCDANSGCGVAGGSRSNNIQLSCGQTCGAPRRDCRHTCTALCHPSSPCPDQRCEFMVTITCLCGLVTTSVPCGAGGGSSDSVYEASIIQKLPVPLQPVDPNGKRVPLGQRKLTCDEDCEKMERKRVLADAFDITPPNLDALHFGENPALTDLISDVFRREPKWVLAVEDRFKFLVLGKTKGASSGSLKVHVFCPMMKDKRDVVRQMAEHWKLTVHAAGWEPKRFLVVHVTPKSKPPARILGSKVGVPLTAVTQPPVFDALVDMDPRLVISLFDLPRDADISALVLRFGGECELAWMNDKNALAVFSDPVRAATALRRLDHGSAYHGAAMLVQRQNERSSSCATGIGSGGSGAWGVGAQPRSGNPWKKVVAAGQGEGLESWEGLGAAAPAWRVSEGPLPALRNRWNALEMDATINVTNTSSVTITSTRTGVLESGEGGHGLNAAAGNEGHTQGRGDGRGIIQEETVDDWEEAYD